MRKCSLHSGKLRNFPLEKCMQYYIITLSCTMHYTKYLKLVLTITVSTTQVQTVDHPLILIMSICRTEKFRQTLMTISKHMSSEILVNLKFMCQDVVPAGDMEKIKSALDFFQALEKYGKISSENSDYLFTILERVGGTKLAKILRPFCSDEANQEMSFSSHSGLVVEEFDILEAKFRRYRQLLSKISSSLTRENVLNLCLFSQEAELAGVRNYDNIDGLAFIDFLEKTKLISPSNLEYLRERLHEIGRADLQHLINQYAVQYLNGQPTMSLDTLASTSTHHQAKLHGVYDSSGIRVVCVYAYRVHNIIY